MAHSSPAANASPNIFAVNPSGYVTIIPSMYLPFFPIGRIYATDPCVVTKQAKVVVGNAEGYECVTCKDFYPMAELNQPDNATEYTSFACYSCRKGLKTFFKEIGESK